MDVDLDIKDTSSFFRVAPEQWERINKHVFLCWRDRADSTEYALRCRSLPGWAEAKRESALWPSYFAELKALAALFGGQRESAAIKSALDAIDVGFEKRPSAAEAQELLPQIEKLQGAVGEIHEASRRLLPGIRAFVRTNQRLLGEFSQRSFPKNQFVQVQPRVDLLAAELPNMSGRWSMIHSYLTELRNLVDKLFADSPKRIRIRVSRRTWDETIAAAQQFLSICPRCEAVLNGESYYDDTGIVASSSRRPGRLYRLATQFQTWGQEVPSVLTASPTDLRLYPEERDLDNKHQMWGFKQLQAGWYGLFNYGIGDTLYLGSPGGDDLVLCAPERKVIEVGVGLTRGDPLWLESNISHNFRLFGGTYSYQYRGAKKTPPVQWFRIVQASKRGLYSMESLRFHSPVAMAETEDSPAQLWSLEEVGAPV